jgi:hypothetical protein
VVNIHPGMNGKHEPTVDGKGIADIDRKKQDTSGNPDVSCCIKVSALIERGTFF